MKYVVFDLDGTLADIEHRRHLVNGAKTDWDLFYNMCLDDRPNRPIIEALCAFYEARYWVEIWSARSAVVREKTELWLHAHHIPFDYLRMRPEDQPDIPDTEIKRLWLLQYRVAGDGDPFIVFDDRQKVVDMWRAHGVTCCQVAPGDF